MKTIDWKHLTFSYTECAKMVRCSFKNGQWGEVYVTSDFYISIHAADTALQYAQQAFEGLKAFRGVDGKVRIFRPEANAHPISTTTWTTSDLSTRKRQSFSLTSTRVCTK